MDKVIDFLIENNNGNCLLKLQNGDVWELNIRLKKDEMNLLKNIKKADWENRKSIKAGISANAYVFWAYWTHNNNEIVSIMVGDDDETWDFAVMVPLETIEKIFVE